MKTVLVILLLSTMTAGAIAVQPVYVGSFGTSDDAERLRMLLSDDLRSEGFVIAEDPAKAEVTLSGILTVQNVQNRTEAYVTATLMDKEGKQLWKGNYGSSFHAGNDAVKWRASDLAKAMKKLRAQ